MMTYSELTWTVEAAATATGGMNISTSQRQWRIYVAAIKTRWQRSVQGLSIFKPTALYKCFLLLGCRKGCTSIVMIMSVCLSVRISLEPHVQLQTPIRGAQVLLFVCLYNYLSVSA